MIEQQISPELEAFIATKMMENKPYLLALEERVATLGYGTLDFTITVRAGVVEKMDFHEHKTWMKPKFDLK